MNYTEPPSDNSSQDKSSQSAPQLSNAGIDFKSAYEVLLKSYLRDHSDSLDDQSSTEDTHHE